MKKLIFVFLFIFIVINVFGQDLQSLNAVEIKVLNKEIVERKSHLEMYDTYAELIISIRNKTSVKIDSIFGSICFYYKEEMVSFADINRYNSIAPGNTVFFTIQSMKIFHKKLPIDVELTDDIINSYRRDRIMLDVSLDKLTYKVHFIEINYNNGVTFEFVRTKNNNP